MSYSIYDFVSDMGIEFPAIVFVCLLVAFSIIYKTREYYKDPGQILRDQGVSFDEIAKRMGRERQNEIRFFERQNQILDVNPTIRAQFPSDYKRLSPFGSYKKAIGSMQLKKLSPGATSPAPATEEGYKRLRF